MWSALSHHDIDSEDPACSDARRRVLGRLGEYAELIVRPLNFRPTGVALLSACDERVEVRVSTPLNHVVLAIAPEGDLAGEVFWLRALAPANLPVPRLIAHDLSCTLVPFTYAIESYAGGLTLDRLEDGPRMRVIARQVGRTLRRAHQLAAPGFGRPTAMGRWPARTWRETLYGWLERRATVERAEEALGADLTLALLDATIDHPALDCKRACAIHGAVEPGRAIVTVGDTTQLEALTRPGELVGGDPLFDLAYGLLPRHSDAFRQGLLEGYTASGALSPEQAAVLPRLGLLLRVADALARGEPAALSGLADEVVVRLRELGES